MILDTLLEIVLRQSWPALGGNLEAFRAQVPLAFDANLVERWWRSVQGKNSPTFLTRGVIPQLPCVVITPGREDVVESPVGQYVGRDDAGRDMLGEVCREVQTLTIYGESTDQVRAIFLAVRAILWLRASQICKKTGLSALEYGGAQPLLPAEAFEIEKRGGWGRAMSWELTYLPFAVDVAALAPFKPLFINTYAVKASLEDGELVLDEAGTPGGVTPVEL